MRLELNAILVEAESLFVRLCANYATLKKVVPAAEYYRYSDHWHFANQRATFVVSFTQFLRDERFVTQDQVIERLGCMFSWLFLLLY